MWRYSVIPLIAGVVKTVYSGLFEERVNPQIGSIVHCDIVPGFANHSGIYVGNNRIICLSSEGEVVEVHYSDFYPSLYGAEEILSPCIWVSCCGENPVGSSSAVERARAKLNSYRDYHFIMENCHQFCSGCLSGDFENSSVLLSFLETDCKEHIGFDNWRIWSFNDVFK
jgi:hypothetical protein